MTELEIIKAYEANELHHMQVYPCDINENILDIGDENIAYTEVNGIIYFDAQGDRFAQVVLKFVGLREYFAVYER